MNQASVLKLADSPGFHFVSINIQFFDAAQNSGVLSGFSGSLSISGCSKSLELFDRKIDAPTNDLNSLASVALFCIRRKAQLQGMIGFYGISLGMRVLVFWISGFVGSRIRG